ncbi:MAG: hypothetical protein KC620_19465 [Myxococcales bacterium]|nr:hypothetical protein [Myxococcales bacterium]
MRALGPLEYVVALADRAARLNFVMVADLRGPLDGETLRAALAAAQRRHPLLRVRLAPHRWRRLAFAEIDTPIPLCVEDCAPEAVPARCAHEALTALPEAEGPLVRAVLLHTGPERHALLLAFHHAIGDGTSGTWLLRDVLAAMVGPVSAAPVPAPIEHHMPRWSFGVRGVWAHLRFVTRTLGRLRRLRGIPGYQIAGAPRIAGSDCGLYIERRDVPPAITQILAARCKREGTTVHGALGAALLLAAFVESDGRPVVGLGSPVNLRDRLNPPVGGDVGLFITMVAGLHRLDPQPDFWDLAREVRSELHAMAERGDVFAAIPFQARFLAALAPWLGRGAAGARRLMAIARLIWLKGVGLSNLGRVDIDAQVGPLAVDAVGFCAAPTNFGDLVAFAATVGGHMTLHFVGVTPHVPEAALTRIADAVMSRIQAESTP